MITFESYIEKTRITWNDQGQVLNDKHALLGIIDEIGELANAVKKKVGYGKVIDITNIKEEAGDLIYYVARIVDQRNFQLQLKDKVFENLNNLINTKKVPETAKKLTSYDIILNCQLSASNIITVIDGKIASVEQVNMLINSIFALVDNISVLSLKCQSTLEKVMKANIAKLEARHGSSFNMKATEEAGRDREKEAKIIKKNT